MARKQKVYAVFVQGAFVVRAQDPEEAYATAKELIAAIVDRDAWKFETIVDEQLGRSSLRLSYPAASITTGRNADGS